MPDKLLSICIPTYNRSEYLRECLSSVLTSVAGHERGIEIVISDNASTDDTVDIIHSFQINYPWIRCYRNNENIGGDRNIYLVATMALGEYLWIFGDDDKMEENAVPRILQNIRDGYDLTICNYSLWDKQFSVKRRKNGIPGKRDQSFENSNILIKRFGLHLGYISAVIIKKSIFLRLPADEYEPFVEYGFPHLYAIYTGLAKGDYKMRFIATPLFCNRGGNSGNFDWYKYFVTGSSLIFNKLLSRGYTKSAVLSAKHQVLKDFVIPHMLFMKLLGDGNNKKYNIGLMFSHYKKNWLFWLACVPVFFVPPFLVHVAKNILLIIRQLNGKKS